MIRIKTIKGAMLACLFLYGPAVFSQTHYLHFTTKEGLPSNKVYCAIQDASGFMWFGTDNGLVRYNGSEFKAFTVKDGLPDNDIYAVFEDRYKRIWIMGLKQAPCYFYKNKLYTPANDSFLARYFTDPDMFRFSVNSSLRRIIFYVIYKEQFTLLEYRDKPWIEVIPNGKFPARNYIKGPVLNLYEDGKNQYLINYSFIYKIGSKKPPILHYTGSPHIAQFKRRDSTLGYYSHQTLPKIILFRFDRDSMTIIKEIDAGGDKPPFIFTNNHMMFVRDNGEIYTLDSTTLELKKENVPLLTGKVSTSAVDNKGNRWLCTHDNGVYVYPKHTSKILSTKRGATSLAWNPEKREIIAGFEDKLIEVSDGITTRSIPVPDEKQTQSRITSLVFSKGFLYMGADRKLARFNTDTREYKRYYEHDNWVINVIKDLELCQDNRILVGSANGAGFFSTEDGKMTEIIWKTRTNAVCDVPGKGVFLGTVNGLHYRPAGQKEIRPYVSHTDLDKARITDIKYDKKGRIWIGTAQFGIFVIDGIKVINISDNKSDKCFITSYYVKCIYVDQAGIVWAGTDKGINRISYINESQCWVERIVASFGIPNDNVSAILVQGDTIYTASLEGISSFKYNSAVLREVPGLEITGMYVNGERLQDISLHMFEHLQNNISIEYSAIAFHSARNIEFRYRLGPEEDWINTLSNRIDFPGLKPGNYVFEIKAVNLITGEESRTRSINFRIHMPWYQRSWFISLVVLLTAFGIWRGVKFRISRIRMQSEETNRISKQFIELEMQALRAQMNPHFIFNALTAIQNYFVSNKEELANSYMSRFARLIRQMLDYSRDNFIPLDEEISLLRNYMSLECMRFENSLDFRMEIDPAIETSEYVLPSLLLQPVLENAVNHGVIPSKRDNMIQLKIYIRQNDLVCEILDNGIGFNQSKKEKIRPNGHQSKGMEILYKRIESINYLYNSEVRFELTDLSVILPPLTGTRILIYFPLALVSKTIINHI